MEKLPEKKYWSSLAQYENDPKVLETMQTEFQASPIREGADEDKDGIGRRDFMKLMAASTALASSACFQRPMHKILPYVNQPEEVSFGIANYYASTCEECQARCGLLVKTREGRPIKLEGNPDHPMNRGGLCARGQAGLLNLYDPDRLRSPVTLTRGNLTTKAATWGDVDHTISEELKKIKAKGGHVRILSESIVSPTTLKLVRQFLGGFASGKLVSYDPISVETIATAQELSYGTKVLPRYRFENADYIVSIDADFLGTWISPVEFTKQFTKNRKVSSKNKKMSKLVAFESILSVTGSNADERVAIRPEDGAKIALALAQQISPSDATKDYTAAAVAKQTGVSEEQIVRVAKELSKHKGKSLVVAGSPQSLNENALSLQVAVNLLNSILQNDGVTVDAVSSPSLQSTSHAAELSTLIEEMKAGKVDALFIYRANPIYNLPKSLGFADAASKVKLVVSFDDRANESAVISDYILPDNHSLESWGDAEPQKGLYSLVQPTIRPIYDTRSFQDSLLKLGGMTAKDWHEYLQNNWRETVFKESGMNGSFQTFWEAALRDGVVDVANKKGLRNKTTGTRAVKASAVKDHLPHTSKKGSGFSLAFYSPVGLYDGKNANNPWLQEFPDPVTRITWDNYVSVSPDTSKKLKVIDGDVLRVKTQSGSFDLTAHVQPGLRDDVAAIGLGYGRTAAGKVGNAIGLNMFQNSGFKAGSQYSGFEAELSKTGEKRILASVQDQHSLNGRPIIKEATLKEFDENPYAGNEEKEKLTTIWKEHPYTGYRWAMAIDLNSCTGCGACVLGCQSENNIPTVGKDGVFRGRVMHWMRIDRYYTGTPDSPQVVTQPMLCQHCENAPCETVCPVVATTHDDEGLNQQTYNRCVGTRYCANNCPYKVRRFNWFDYNFSGQTRYPATLAQNPEVTVRSRGVMEKCTFCIQRIHDGKNTAKDLGRKVLDGEIKTACQQSCPGDAIVFGDINDNESEVHKLAKDTRGYHVLEELNVRPSITYLTKIRNTENV